VIIVGSAASCACVRFRKRCAIPVSVRLPRRAQALGLGVNSAVLSLANAIFLKPLRLPDAGRLVIVDQTRPDRPQREYGVSYPDYVYFRDHATLHVGRRP
jgi:hypothetical protein